jgi:hypothetical protein
LTSEISSPSAISGPSIQLSKEVEYLDFSLPSYGDSAGSSATPKKDAPSFSNPFADFDFSAPKGEPAPSPAPDAVSDSSAAEEKVAAQVEKEAAEAAKKAEKEAAEAAKKAEKDAAEAAKKAEKEARRQAEKEKQRLAVERANNEAKEAQVVSYQRFRPCICESQRSPLGWFKYLRLTHLALLFAMIFLKNEAPALSLPDIKAPDFELPNLKVPDVKFEVPDFKSPDIKMPDVSMPTFSLPKVEMPKVDFPKVDAPSFSVPQSSVEKPKVPSFSTPSFGGSGKSEYESLVVDDVEPQEVRDERARAATAAYKMADASAKVCMILTCPFSNSLHVMNASYSCDPFCLGNRGQSQRVTKCREREEKYC